MDRSLKFLVEKNPLAERKQRVKEVVGDLRRASSDFCEAHALDLMSDMESASRRAMRIWGLLAIDARNILDSQGSTDKYHKDGPITGQKVLGLSKEDADKILQKEELGQSETQDVRLREILNRLAHRNEDRHGFRVRNGDHFLLIVYREHNKRRKRRCAMEFKVSDLCDACISISDRSLAHSGPGAGIPAPLSRRFPASGGFSDLGVAQPKDRTGDMEPEFTREQVEEAMDAYDRYLRDGEYSEIFGPRGKRPDFWVRSTRDRPKRVYPSRLIVRWLLRETRQKGIGGGWSRKDSAATVLHNSGFVIAGEDDKPELPDEKYKHPIPAQGARRIRLCARNYFIEPAREKHLANVAIRAGRLAYAMGLENAAKEICQALESREFQEMAGVPEPGKTGPDESPATEFRFDLGGQGHGKSALEEFYHRTTGMPGSTEAERLVRQRVGQDAFRRELLKRWKRRCPMTGISDEALLRASHIIPWSGCKDDAERLDPDNGLLLSALWDLAFDDGLVTFGGDGRPIFSPVLGERARSGLERPGQRLIGLTDGHRANLAWHREHVFKPGK